MEFHEAIRQRRMVRSFSSASIEPAVVDHILDAALRSPTAGNTSGTAWVVLEGPEQTATFWDATTDVEWRTRNPRRSAGLQRAPVLLLAYSSPDAYVDRYTEADKSGSGLGEGAHLWPVPYWTGDAAFGVMTVLLGAVDAGLGACILGTFRGEDELATRLGVPQGWRLFCAVALGRRDGDDHRSTSLDRQRPLWAERVHRSRWRSRLAEREVSDVASAATTVDGV
jgi:nitroreductase